MKIFTIGFTNKKAERFFEKLQQEGVKRVIDVRLNNVSQLAGFSKKDDLKYFLRAIAGIDYIHVPELAPTKELLDAYKKKKGGWSVYETEFQQSAGASTHRKIDWQGPHRPRLPALQRRQAPSLPQTANRRIPPPTLARCFNRPPLVKPCLRCELSAFCNSGFAIQ